MKTSSKQSTGICLDDVIASLENELGINRQPQSAPSMPPVHDEEFLANRRKELGLDSWTEQKIKVQALLQKIREKRAAELFQQTRKQAELRLQGKLEEENPMPSVWSEKQLEEHRRKHLDMN